MTAVTADQVSTSCVGCVTNTNISQVAGSKITGEVPVASIPAGSGSYIQNTSTQQAASSFNISGSGTIGGTVSANAVNSETQINIRGVRAFTIVGAGSAGFGGGSTLAGAGVGQNLYPDTIGDSFFGLNAGKSTTSGGSNAFFGYRSGENNTTGFGNSFFGLKDPQTRSATTIRSLGATPMLVRQI